MNVKHFAAQALVDKLQKQGGKYFIVANNLENVKLTLKQIEYVEYESHYSAVHYTGKFPNLRLKNRVRQHIC